MTETTAVARESRAFANSDSGVVVGLGVIGCGRVFERFHLPALKHVRGLRLVAACDPSQRARTWLQRLCPDTLVTPDSEPLLRHPGVDAVLIATPPQTHCAMALAALEAGRHVLVEKPMGTSAGEARALAEYAAAANRVVAVGFVRRFRTPYVRLRERLARIEPGAIRGVRFMLSFPHRGWAAVTGYLGRDPGGGVLEDVVSHQLDLVAWLFASPLKSLDVHQWRRSPGQDEAIRYHVRLENGVSVQCSAQHHPRYEERILVGYGDRVLLAHAYGLLDVPHYLAGIVGASVPLLGQAHLARCRISRRSNCTAESFTRQLEAFAGAVRSGVPYTAMADGDSAVLCHRAMEACRRSHTQGAGCELTAA